MPIYEYECGRCGRRFEYMQKMSEAPKTKCEACGGRLVRLISPAGFQLKGSGWYKTDYAAKGDPRRKEKETEAGKDKPADKTASQDKEKKKE